VLSFGQVVRMIVDLSIPLSILVAILIRCWRCTDGRAILAVNEDRVLDVYEFPNEENGHRQAFKRGYARPRLKF
jgi:hypothetical protein